uniref:Uncharacterized protein n=1 Tax=Parascaris univalens TaxID=6257 RepID=A0A915BAU6_PARUN
MMKVPKCFRLMNINEGIIVINAERREKFEVVPINNGLAALCLIISLERGLIGWSEDEFAEASFECLIQLKKLLELVMFICDLPISFHATEEISLLFIQDFVSLNETFNKTVISFDDRMISLPNITFARVVNIKHEASCSPTKSISEIKV